MAEQSGVTYTKVDKSYFEKRGLRRYAGVWSLWALGVGAVISGHFSGWNLGLANGWGSMLLATGIIAVMYLGLTFSPWRRCRRRCRTPAVPIPLRAPRWVRGAALLTGLSENVEYVLTPAVIVFFIGSYMGGIFETAPQYQPLWWIGFYVVFVILNVVGVELSFKVTVAITLLALACLVVFWVSALPHIDFNLWAMNVQAGGVAEGNQALAEGGGPFLPQGLHRGCSRRCPSPSGCSSPSNSCRWRPRNR